MEIKKLLTYLLR